MILSKAPFLRFLNHTAKKTSLAIFLMTGAMVSSSYAQDAAEAAAPVQKTFLQTWYLDGGFMMHPILLLSICTLTILTYCIIQINRSKFAPHLLRAQLLDHLSNLRFRSAIETAQASPTYLGRMMSVALTKADVNDPKLGRDNIENVMADFTVSENRGYQVWLGYLSTIIAVAPMMGLLGTIQGMVGAFATLGQTRGSDPGALASDISIALLTTLGGLVVAIPTVIIYAVYRNIFTGLVAEVHDAAGEMLDAAEESLAPGAALARIPEGLGLEDHSA